MTDAYEPNEDSLFLYKEVEKVRADRVAEVGVGSGFILRHYVDADMPDLALGTDVDVAALKVARNRDASGSAEYVLCRSCDCLREGSFQLVFFNPPYLISERNEDMATSGGRTGVEVTYEMAVSSFRALADSGKLIFLASSLSDTLSLAKWLHEADIGLTKLTSKKLFFEELVIYMAVKRGVNRKSR